MILFLSLASLFITLVFGVEAMTMPKSVAERVFSACFYGAACALNVYVTINIILSGKL